ncbi:hypothetical protein GF323_03855 [Candidatus Woesearchaeota archaeon]|nr:hypothetical protein [Candidatus Woesearchaeota archaeon]
MKREALLLAFLMLVPFSFSEINILGIKQAYNIGEDILPRVNISLEEETEGFRTAKIECSSFSRSYYVEQGILSESFLPSLKTFSEMLGRCTLIVQLEKQDSSILGEKRSDAFEVTEKLIPGLDIGVKALNPSDTLNIEGSLYNARQEPVKGMLSARLSDNDYNYVIDDEKFSFGLEIPSDIESGENKLLLTFEDNKGNYADELVLLEIMPKPTSMEAALDDDLYLPYEEINAQIFLLDQAGASLDREIAISITKDKESIYSANHSVGIFKYPLDNILEPGEYAFSVSYGGISAEEKFSIAALQQIDNRLEDQKAVITNTGNVDYENRTSIIIVRKDGEIVVEKKVSLKPDESYKIDLSKEMPEGNYSVVLPKGEKIDNVHVEDNRNIFKKASSGLSSIAGNFVRVTKKSNAGLSILIFFLVVIVGLAVLQYYGLPVLPAVKDGAMSIYKKIKIRKQ